MSKKVFVFLLFTLCIHYKAYSQKDPVKFGDVSLEELKMTRYDKDSSASAIVLADFGETEMRYSQETGFSLVFQRTKRIKILKKEGYDFATMEVSTYHSGQDEEKMQGLKAVTYNIEGGKKTETKMKSDAVFKEKYDDNINITKFTLPNIKEGSVIEISYQIISDFLFNFQDWEFQSTIPIKWSEYRATIPEYFNYEKYMQGYVGLVANESKQTSRSVNLTYKEESHNRAFDGGNTSNTQYEQVDYTASVFRWAAQNVPAFKEEPFMNNSSDYISKLNFELSSTKFPNKPIKNYMGTWESLNALFLESEDFGKVLKGSNFLNETVQTLTNNVSNPTEKASKIYDYIKDNVEWNGKYRKYTESSFKKILEDKKGSSAEINLLLTSMLKKANIKADPVLISTRNHGFVREGSAVSAQFNYVICAVDIDNKIILLDATDRFLPMNIIPERCLNGNGYIISETKPGWVPLVANFKSRTVISSDLNIDTEGQLKGNMKITKEGYDAQQMRKDYVTKGEQSYIKKLAEAHSWEFQKSEFENVKKLSDAVKESYELTISDHIQSANGIYYFNPILTQKIEENPFRLEKREYPVDFGSPFEKTLICKINLPSELTIDELPKPKMIVLPNGSGRYVYNISQIGNSITFTSQLVINKALFVQDEYPHLREFYSQMIAKQTEQIVLKRK